VSVTGALARHAMSGAPADLPAAAAVVAKQCLLDVIGVTLAGFTEPVAGIVAAEVLDEMPNGPATILGHGRRTGVTGAALANGTAAHALDFDDVNAAIPGHPSAVVFPAVLAVGEAQGSSGADVLAAFIAGYETVCRVGAAVGGHYDRGFHATATAGAFGAAVGAARLLGLGAPACETALGLAATQAAGLRSMFGTMTKPFHAGRAAAAGVLAARLAARGMTSATDAIAVAQGFAATQADGLDADVLTAPFGAPWHVERTLFKMHASCYFTHAGIDAALAVQRDRPIPTDGIEEVVIRVNPSIVPVCDIAEPRTGLEAKFSLRFTTALALAVGRATEADFGPHMVTDPTLQALWRKVTVVPDPRISAYASEVVVRTRDGGQHSAGADASELGWRTDPAQQWPALFTKFHGLVDPVIGRERADALAGLVDRFPELPDVRQLVEFSIAPRTGGQRR
jgi:2-methylcitrate dehydratase PrpD